MRDSSAIYFSYLILNFILNTGLEKVVKYEDVLWNYDSNPQRLYISIQSKQSRHLVDNNGTTL